MRCALRNGALGEPALPVGFWAFEGGGRGMILAQRRQDAKKREGGEGRARLESPPYLLVSGRPSAGRSYGNARISEPDRACVICAIRMASPEGRGVRLPSSRVSAATSSLPTLHEYEVVLTTSPVVLR